MPSEAEIHFSKIRHKLKDEIHDFVQNYAKKAEVTFIGLSIGLAGSVLGHTLQGHDVAFEYNLADSKDEARTEFLGIRIRHEAWKPKVTIWGSRSMMESFFAEELTEAMKEKIRDCVDKTITQA